MTASIGDDDDDVMMANDRALEQESKL